MTAHLARLCALNAIAALAAVVDDLDRVRIVKVVGFVAGDPRSTGQAGVLNGASLLPPDRCGAQISWADGSSTRSRTVT